MLGHLRRATRCSGRRIADPEASKGPPGGAAGLGLLDIETALDGAKRLAEVAAGDRERRAGRAATRCTSARPTGPALARPLLELGGRPDGAVSADGRIMGCYLHGLFAADGFRHAFLSRLRRRGRSPGSLTRRRSRPTLDALADHLEAALDLDGLLELARSGE